MGDIIKNFAITTVATAPTPATSGTSLIVTDASVFPATPFNATVWPTGTDPITSNAEIVRVTNISTNTLTITREQESSSARTIIIGDNIAQNITKKYIDDKENKHSYTIAKDGTGDYNCTGSDHTGDDQVVINQAMNEIPANSNIIFKPATYYLKGKGKSGAGPLDWGAIHIEKTFHIRAYGAIFDNQQGETAPTDEDDEYTVCFEWVSDNICDGSTWYGGTFNYTDRVTTPTSGGGAIWIRPKDNAGTYFEGNNIKIKDIIVDVGSTVSFGSFGIYNQRCNNVSIDNCTFKNTNSSAITFDGMDTDADNVLDMRISNCEFDSCDRGIRHNDTDVFLRNINIVNCSFKDCAAPIFIGVSKNINLSNIIIEDTTGSSAITLGHSSVTTLESVNLSNIIIDGVTDTDADGLLIDNVDDKINISGLTITNVDRYAIHLQRLKTKNILIDGLLIDQTDTTDGWGLYSYYDTGVEKNTFQISNATILPKKSGLKINGYEDINLSNIIVDGDSSNDNNQYGIQIMSNSTNVNLSNVKIKNWDDSGTGKDILFQNSGSKNIINTNNAIGVSKQSLTLGVGDTTFAITGSFMEITGDGGGNTISTITGALEGQKLTLLFVDGNVAITDTAAHGTDTVDLSAAFTSADDTTLELIYNGTSWYETSRSVN